MPLISGILKNASGVRRNTQIVLRAIETSADVINKAPDYSIVTDANGRYSFSCAVGLYSVRIIEEGMQPESVGTIQVLSTTNGADINSLLLAEKIADTLSADLVAQFEQAKSDTQAAAAAAQSSANAATQSANTLYAAFTGMIAPFHKAGAINGWIDLKGGSLSRTVDAKLWAYAQSSGLLIAQATKNADPVAHAMKFGDGDGSTTFTLPHHHLGHFVRGNPSGVAHGVTQGDAIRNISGELVNNKDHSGTIYSMYSGTGAFSIVFSTSEAYVPKASTSIGSGWGHARLDASTQVPTAEENRPKTANLTYKIFRGFI